MEKIFIPGNVPSSKNSRRIIRGKSLPSKATVKYRDNTKKYWKKFKKDFIKMTVGKKKPYKVHFMFVRGTRHKFDYINPAQTLQDEMTKYGWIDDDNCEEILPVFHPYKYDKEKPGVYIWVE